MTTINEVLSAEITFVSLFLSTGDDALLEMAGECAVEAERLWDDLTTPPWDDGDMSEEDEEWWRLDALADCGDWDDITEERVLLALS